MTDEEFLTAFEAAAINRADWTHEAHVRMAWLYLSRGPSVEALDRIRIGIKKLNARIGSADGYHETITVAFVRLIASRMEPGESHDAFRERNPLLFDRKLAALLHYYSKDRLDSAAARKHFIEPDLRPLPPLASIGS
ncbi:MAG TPA: hypothetical protein VLM40_11295 [Gemmata sp.]|nr:hypothetical protein [Gemmata sp.]